MLTVEKVPLDVFVVKGVSPQQVLPTSFKWRAEFPAWLVTNEIPIAITKPCFTIPDVQGVFVLKYNDDCQPRPPLVFERNIRQWLSELGVSQTPHSSRKRIAVCQCGCDWSCHMTQDNHCTWCSCPKYEPDTSR
jgi:hypothetical protein